MGNQKSESEDDDRLCWILLPFPLLALVTVILFSIALFCPNTPTLNNVAQITISPSTELQPRNQAPTTRPDGPTVWFGIFGEIHTETLLPFVGFEPHPPQALARRATRRQTSPAPVWALIRHTVGFFRYPVDSRVNPAYLVIIMIDFSVLPPNAPTYVLLSPPIHYKVFGYIAFGLWPILFLMASLICWHVMSGTVKWVGKYLMEFPVFFWLGLFAGIVGKCPPD